ncbi:MAG: response regulator [Mariprofundaceae bacterium]
MSFLTHCVMRNGLKYLQGASIVPGCEVVEMELIGRGATVLIADDDPMFCVILRQFFEGQGYTVITVVDGNEAVEAFVRDVPEVVMLDAEMPELDGFAACEAIRSHPNGATTPIFIVTALEGQAAFECAFAAEASDYITKPIDWAEFRNKLSCVMEVSFD